MVMRKIMTKTFVVADTHFGHRNIITFNDKDNEPIRPFSTIEEHDKTLINNWNNTIGKKDTVYHLGDVVINRKALQTLSELNGRKILIKGNHDIFKLKEYILYFEDIRAYKIFPEQKIILSHIPIHPDSLKRWNLNIHGHLHQNQIKDKKYLCVSVEQTNYKPLNIQSILNEYKNRKNN